MEPLYLGRTHQRMGNVLIWRQFLQSSVIHGYSRDIHAISALQRSKPARNKRGSGISYRLVARI
jgi:hypothetical protein